MDISILLATCRRPNLLAQTLDSFTRLKTQGLSWEVVIIDNSDDPQTQAVSEQYAAHFALRLLIEKKPGKNRALNQALRHAHGQLYVFTDDDVRVEPDWLLTMWTGTGRWPGHSVFGGRIRVELPPGGLPLAADDRYYRAAYADADWKDEEGPYKAAKVFGPNMAIRAAVFRDGWSFRSDLGPKGSNYVMGGETEFVERLERSGMNAVYLPESVVWHKIRPDQMTSIWLHRRAFCYGRMLAYCGTGPKPRFVFGQPLGLVWRRMGLAMYRAICFGQKKRLLLEMDVSHLQGMTYQYRQRNDETSR